ncbi:GlxA family transcriptional regulator [Actinoplanes sp. CA-030573]|uniref:GlxA family transcriptional regulator n=1 Tax=Actinoplanes sp. CA-030573 TaxID=3239898 RepID=UPI003D8CABD5
MTRSRTTVGVLVGDDAPMLEVAVAPRVFEAGRHEVRVAGEHEGPLRTTAGIAITPPCPLTALDEAGIVVVPGWRLPGGTPVGPGILDALRRAHDEGATVVGLCLGAFVLAEAGLLDGRRATTHWRYLPELAARFPGIEVVADAMRHALDHLGDPALDVDRLATVVHVSRRTFDRRFREAAGCSPLQWLLHQRVLHAQDLLAGTELTIDGVARAAGFAGGVAMRPHFRRILGVSPQAYRAAFKID